MYKLCAICGRFGRGDNLKTHMAMKHRQYPKEIFRFLRNSEIPLHFGESLSHEFIDEESARMLSILDAEAKIQDVPVSSSYTWIIEAHKA